MGGGRAREGVPHACTRTVFSRFPSWVTAKIVQSVTSQIRHDGVSPYKPEQAVKVMRCMGATRIADRLRRSRTLGLRIPSAIVPSSEQGQGYMTNKVRLAPSSRSFALGLVSTTG